MLKYLDTLSISVFEHFHFFFKFLVTQLSDSILEIKQTENLQNYTE